MSTRRVKRAFLRSLKFGKTFAKVGRDGATTAEMYTLAKHYQPREAQGGPCTHYDRIVLSCHEWQHRLRSEQQQLRLAGLFRLENHVWYLV